MDEQLSNSCRTPIRPETEPAPPRRSVGPLSYMPLQPISEISVKLGSSAVAEFGFGLRLWGCRWKRPAPRIGEVNPIKVSI